MFCLVGAQRLVVFIGSPIEEDEKALVKIGKLLKKNNVRIVFKLMEEYTNLLS